MDKPISKLSFSKDLVGLMAALLPIVGAVGTIFVLLTANLFVGDVEVLIPQVIRTFTVNVYNEKGQNSTFHTPHFQLMPGQYHLEIVMDEKKIHRADVQVAFHQKTTVNVDLPHSDGIASTVKTKRHWWQFWRKNKASNQLANDLYQEAQ